MPPIGARHGAGHRLHRLHHRIHAERAATALVPGDTMLAKPPETSPLTVLVLGEVARDTFPACVFNIVNGMGAEVGDTLVRHPNVKQLALIGAVPTELVIPAQCGRSQGQARDARARGKNPMIVFPDPDAAAESAVCGTNLS